MNGKKYTKILEHPFHLSFTCNLPPMNGPDYLPAEWKSEVVVRLMNGSLPKIFFNLL